MSATVTSIVPRHDVVRLALRRGQLAGPVLSSVVGSVAGRADLAVDRIHDAVLIADALAAQNHLDRLDVLAITTPGILELRVGPVPPGDARCLLGDGQPPGIGRGIDCLADEITVQISERRGELLVIRLETCAP